MSNTPLLSLPEISESQSGKYITHNEGLNLLEAINTRVLSRSNSGPPDSPSEGDTYIVDTASGDWSTASVNDLAHYFGGGWYFVTPVQGLDIHCVDESCRLYYTGSAWTIYYSHKVNFTANLADQDFVGEFDTLNVKHNAQGFGCALRFDTNGDLVNADCRSYDNMPCSVLALEPGTGSKTVLWRGKIKNTSWNLDPGKYAYIGISGEITSTRPNTSGNQVQVAGVARLSGELIFNPSYVIVEID